MRGGWRRSSRRDRDPSGLRSATCSERPRAAARPGRGRWRRARRGWATGRRWRPRRGTAAAAGRSRGPSPSNDQTRRRRRRRRARRTARAAGAGPGRGRRDTACCAPTGASRRRSSWSCRSPRRRAVPPTRQAPSPRSAAPRSGTARRRPIPTAARQGPRWRPRRCCSAAPRGGSVVRCGRSRRGRRPSSRARAPRRAATARDTWRRRGARTTHRASCLRARRPAAAARRCAARPPRSSTRRSATTRCVGSPVEPVGSKTRTSPCKLRAA